jgi:hypothetical protein
MNESLERIVREFHANLATLAEGPTPAYDADVISHGKSEGHAPRWQATTESECLAIYSEANHAVRKMLKRPRVPGERFRDKAAVLAGFRMNLKYNLPGAALDVLDDANRDVRQVIERFKRKRAPDLTAEGRNLWIIAEGEGMDAFAVARRFGVSVDLVLSQRARQGRRLDDGKPKGRGRPSTAGGRARRTA